MSDGFDKQFNYMMIAIVVIALLGLGIFGFLGYKALAIIAAYLHV